MWIWKSSTNWFGRVRTGRKHRAVSILNVSWGRSVFPSISMYQIARAGPNPRDLGCWNTQCSVCSSFPTQRREAGLVHASLRVQLSSSSSSVQGTAQVTLCLPPHSDTPAPLSHPAVYTRCHNSTNFADGGPQTGNCPQFFQIFLKVDHSFNWSFLEPLGYASPCVRLFEDLWIGWSP